MNIGVGFDIFTSDKSLVDVVDFLNIENPLYPNFLNEDYKIKNHFHKEIIVDGAYIDLNPGTQEEAIQKITEEKVLKSIEFAKKLNAKEIIFLSTYLPFIKVSFYDDGFVKQSTAFWKKITSKIQDIRISLCNTFEETPEILIKIMNGVKHPNFQLAFDIGHALAYGNIGIDKWYYQVIDYINTIYLHSNDGIADLHLNLNEGILLKTEGFMKISNKMDSKNIIIKSFDKSVISTMKNKEIINKLKK